MTLILGLKYDFGRGILIASDSMVTNFDGSLDSQKIHYGFGKRCIAAGTGMSPILDRITGTFGRKFESIGNKVSSFREILDMYEDTTNNIMKRYKKFDSIIDDDSGMFKLMFGVWDDDNERPELFVIGRSCLAYQAEQYEAMGSGAGIALNILREQWNEKLSSDQCMRLAAYCIVKTSEYIETVCPPIQLGIVQDGKIKILNYDENDNFVIDNLQSKILQDDAEKTITKEDESIKKWINNMDEKYPIIPFGSG